MSKVKTITIKTDFNNIPSLVWNEPKALNNLCGQSFDYLGLKD